jgi:hypothetical protein
MNSVHDQPDAAQHGSTADAWNARAGELAAWAWQRLVNRTDVWGGYYRARDNAGDWITQQTTHARKQDRGRVFLTPGILTRHFCGCHTRDIVGLHSTSLENTSRWGAVDADCHGPTSTAAEVNLRAVLAWYDVLVRQRFRPLLTDSNGAGGYHLRILLAEAVATARVYYFLRRLVADHGRHGMAKPPETFPKQPALPVREGKRGYGNWLRLPGRHHTRDHWSRAWDGSRWLEGAAAVEFILALRGDGVALVPEAPPPEPAPPRRSSHILRVTDGNLSARIAGYMRRLPNLGEGQGRDDVAYTFAAWMVRDLAVSDDIALSWLQRWDAGNSPPKGDARLREIIASAHSYAQHLKGSGLTAPAPRADGHGTIRFSLEVG